jgi:hypothetical protein
MSEVSGHLVDKEEDIKILRLNINNILDWSVLNQVQKINVMLQKIYVQEEL